MSKYKVGEKVMWRGGFGERPAEPATIIGTGRNDGRQVYDLDNTHWCYEDQIDGLCHEQPKQVADSVNADPQLAVVKELNRRGVMAFYEHLGYVAVPLDRAGIERSGWCLGFGNDGETWHGYITDCETGDVEERDEYFIDTGLPAAFSEADKIVDRLVVWLAVVKGHGVYFPRACQWFVIGPDELPFNQEAIRSEADARLAIPEYCERYRQQGYYKTARGERIPFDGIAARCVVRTGVEGVI